MEKRELYLSVSRYFASAMEDAVSELRYGNPFELLVAVILSAQCTDKRVNMVTPALFAAYGDAEAMAAAEVGDIFKIIGSISYPNAKARHLSSMARALVANFGGVVPDNRDALQTLAGVGRKTASVVLSVAFNAPEMAVDTHVFRVSARIGLTVGAKTPSAAEKQLLAGFSQIKSCDLPAKIDNVVGTAHHWLILHGRYVCTARKPACERCGLADLCKFYNSRATSI